MTDKEKVEYNQCVLNCRWKTECPNMSSREGDTDMSGDHYDCSICKAHVYLDYEEMR
jgi:hypothetical protein